MWHHTWWIKQVLCVKGFPICSFLQKPIYCDRWSSGCCWSCWHRGRDASGFSWGARCFSGWAQHWCWRPIISGSRSQRNSAKCAVTKIAWINCTGESWSCVYWPSHQPFAKTSVVRHLICNRVKLFSKRIKSHRVEDSESDIPDPTKFGEQVAIGHMIVSKLCCGREFVVLIVYDTFSGILKAYPASSKASDFVYTCLKHFVGLRYQNPDTVCKSDAASELVKAIRSFEGCCRCLYCQAGVAVFPRSWATTCRYAAVATSIDN